MRYATRKLPHSLDDPMTLHGWLVSGWVDGRWPMTEWPGSEASLLSRLAYWIGWHSRKTRTTR